MNLFYGTNTFYQEVPPFSFLNQANMIHLLVLCTGNSCRSQIAHGYLEHYTDGRKVKVYSAGVETHGVNPRAIATMQADGIDISGYTSNLVSEYFNIDFDFVLTVCDHAKERCPYFPTQATQLHYNFPDPAKATGTETEITEQFSIVRAMIKQYCHAFVAEHLADCAVKTTL
jgi:arsenate reductase (thioredoxin)